jgi:hypothetical protein
MRQRELDWSGSRQGQVVGCCENGDELSGYIKCGGAEDFLTNHGVFCKL